MRWLWILMVVGCARSPEVVRDREGDYDPGQPANSYSGAELDAFCDDLAAVFDNLSEQCGVELEACESSYSSTPNCATGSLVLQCWDEFVDFCDPNGSACTTYFDCLYSY